MSITFDSSSHNSTASGTSISSTHTCTGTNLVLFAMVYQSGDTPVGSFFSATYNGVSMTKIDDAFINDANINMALFYLLNPTTGSNTLTGIYASSATKLQVVGASYSNVKQSGVPDTFSDSGGSSTGTSMTGSVTTIADNCWVIMAGGSQQGGLAASTGSTLRDATNGNSGLFDNNASKTPPGSVSMSLTNTSGNKGYIIASFAPFVQSTNTPFLFNLI